MNARVSACAAPPIPKNAHLPVPVVSGTVGQVVQFQCVPGFIPTGPVETICLNNKGVPMWTNPVHKCIGECRDSCAIIGGGVALSTGIKCLSINITRECII